MSIPATPDEIIAAQAVVIGNFVRLQAANQTVITTIVNALRLYMSDLQALGVQPPATLPPDPPVAPPARDTTNVVNFKRPPSPRTR